MQWIIIAALALPLTATAQHLTEETTCTPREYAQYREQASSGKRGFEDVAREYCLNGVVRKLHRDLAANYAKIGRHARRGPAAANGERMPR